MQMLAHPGHQRRQAAGIEEVLHEVGVAARPHIGDHRDTAAGGLEILEPDVVAGAARLRDHMDDGVGGAAHRHGDRDGVLERCARLDPAGVRSSQIMSTMRRPAAEHMRIWLASAAGIDEAPGKVMPIASAIAVMVLAVPMVMQWPSLRATPPSTSIQSSAVIVPARRSSQYFQTSEPEPSTLPFQLPRSIGPAGT